MLEGCPEMGGWGVVAIWKEAGRLMSKYMRLLHPFILAFLLPAALIQLLQLLSLSWTGIAPGEGVPHRFGHDLGHHHHPLHQYHHRHFVFHKEQAAPEASTQKPSPGSLLLLVLTATLTLLTLLLTALTAAAISQLVQYIYAHKEHEDPLVVKKTFESLPQALGRLFVTALWTLALSLATYLLLSLPFYLVSFSKAQPLPPFLDLAHSVLLLVALLALELLFLVSLQVAVLEPEQYGLASLQRSVKLIRSSWLTAFALLLVYFVCVFGLGETYFATVMVCGSRKVPRWVGYVLAFVDALVNLVVVAYWLLAVPVFYFVSRLREGGDEAENAYVPIAVSAEN